MAWALLETIDGFMELTNMIRVFWIDVKRGLLHVKIFSEITMKKCSFDV